MKKFYCVTILFLAISHHINGQKQYQHTKNFAHKDGYKSTLHYNDVDEIFTLTVNGVSVRACGDTALVELLPKKPISETYSAYRCVDRNCNTKEFIYNLDSNTFLISPEEHGYSIQDGTNKVVWYDYRYPVKLADQYDNLIFLDKNFKQLTTINTNHFNNDTVYVRDPDIDNPYTLSNPIHQWYINQQPVTDIKNHPLSHGDSLFIEVDFSAQTYPCTTHKKFFVATIKEQTSSISSISNNLLTLYPNPTHGIIYFEILSKGEPYEIYNTSGTKIESGNYTGTGIDLTKVPSGMYFIRVKNQLMPLIKK